MKILVLNAGSSSHKSCLYEINSLHNIILPLKPLWEGMIDWTVDSNHGLLEVQANGKKNTFELPMDNVETGIKTMLDTMIKGENKVIEKLIDINVVGHRVVHGGKKYYQATFITEEVKATIKELIPLAPNHNPVHLKGINSIEAINKDIRQIAVFDTAFHCTIPDYAKIYPIPYQYYKEGIQRYGFHGISHQYVSQRMAEIIDKPLNSLKIITCHLGNGCSITAIKDGKSINTSMGFTPLEGLMMGSRSGSIDPAILTYFMREYDYDRDEIDQILNKKSGLLGISGISADLRTVLTAMENGDKQAKLAVDIYIHRIQEVIGSFLPSLGGLDALVFTAGIGENSAFIREKVCQKFNFLGVKLDKEKNRQFCIDKNIATDDSSVKILVIHTQEDWAIAKQCYNLIS
ncbi:acetate kinase [Geminocystis sp. NIES-3708]|uniref:acetate/propionate family kinase n=1 Tax=Geminocystis sp. NIES-3708 TaxID=1615909 RepID=UPI0005FC562B|nr:acetate kinase [Geminocystis sp. NIES-3708]BAQ62688.1 acetate kinase [Geminocystis sp. NIES-3708]